MPARRTPRDRGHRHRRRELRRRCRPRLVGIEEDRRRDRGSGRGDEGPHRPAESPRPSRPAARAARPYPPASARRCLHLSEGLRITALPRRPHRLGQPLPRDVRGRLRAEKGQCILHLDDLLGHARGLELILHAPDHAPGHARRTGAAPPCRLTGRLGPQVTLLMAPSYDGQDKRPLRRRRPAGAPTWACRPRPPPGR
jgi:hypothetical protein